MCRVNADVFPGSLNCKHGHRVIVAFGIMSVSLWNSLSHRVSHWSQFATRTGAQPHDAIVTVSDELLNVLAEASIPQIYQSIFQINRAEKGRTFGTTQNCLPMCLSKKSARMPRMFALTHRVRRDLNTVLLHH